MHNILCLETHAIRVPRSFNWERTVFSTKGARKPAPTCKRVRLRPDLVAHMKINSKWTKDLNISTKNTKLIEANGGKL